MLCQYRNIFGEPHEGFHAARIGPYARNDIIATFFVAIIIAVILNTNIIVTTVLLFAASIPIHMLFCVKTQLLVNLGLAK